MDWSLPIGFDRIDLWLDDRSVLPLPAEVDAASVRRHKIKVSTIDAALGEIHGAVETDWGLHLGDDEVMGDHFPEELPRLLAEEGVDVWSFPRYNVSAPGRYYAGEPLYPDLALRLFRRGKLAHPGRVHEGPVPLGPLRRAGSHIFHLDVLDRTRKEREAKWARYVEQGIVGESRDRGLPPWYYRQFAVPEGHGFEERDCEEGCALWSK